VPHQQQSEHLLECGHVSLTAEKTMPTALVS